MNIFKLTLVVILHIMGQLMNFRLHSCKIPQINWEHSEWGNEQIFEVCTRKTRRWWAERKGLRTANNFCAVFMSKSLLSLHELYKLFKFIVWNLMGKFSNRSWSLNFTEPVFQWLYILSSNQLCQCRLSTDLILITPLFWWC